MHACDHCDGAGEVLEPGRTPEEPSRMIPCANCQAGGSGASDSGVNDRLDPYLGRTSSEPVVTTGGKPKSARPLRKSSGATRREQWKREQEERIAAWGGPLSDEEIVEAIRRMRRLEGDHPLPDDDTGEDSCR